MKITGQQPHGISELNVGKGKDAGNKISRAQPRQAQEAANATNRTSLSTMDKIRETIRKEPDVRAERVAELKAKISSGKFKVDSDKLAANMLTAALEEDLERP
jgi:flagellar biosynthesis anti-sigma factor FlgM